MRDMGKSYLILGQGNKPLLKSLELSRSCKGKTIIITDKPLDLEGTVEVIDIFKQLDFIVSIPQHLSHGDNLIVDLYMHASRLSAVTKYSSLKVYLKMCMRLIASAKAKCFNIYISYSGELNSWIYEKLKVIVDEEVTC